MNNNRCNQYKSLIPHRCSRIKFSQRIIIYHQNTKAEIPWHSKYRTRNTYRQKVLHIRKQIQYILQCRKAERHTYRINNPIHFLIKIRILPQQQPQHNKLCNLLRHSSYKKNAVLTLPNISIASTG